MYLSLTVIDRKQEQRQFNFQFDKLEIGLDFLNRVVRQGDILICVDLIDDYKQISLPIAAFDGVSFLPVLKQLEQEWMSILTTPSPVRSPLDVGTIHWYRKKLSVYEQHIISLELMISDVTCRCEP